MACRLGLLDLIKPDVFHKIGWPFWHRELQKRFQIKLKQIKQPKIAYRDENTRF